jgi:type VI secretion system protein ImpJ
MGSNNRVVWSEGMFLRPQHFQQQTRYVESVLNQRVSGARAHAWGITELTLDRAALSIGKIAIAKGTGVLDDGTAFAIPQDTDPPPPVDVPETVRNQRVYVTIPLQRPGMPDTVLRDREDVAARFAAINYDSPDAVAGSDQVAPVQVGRLRLRFAIESVAADFGGLALLPIARVMEVRGGDRQVILDDQFIPPCLSIAAVPLLSAFATELQGLLNHRAEALAARLAQPGMRGASEMANLLLLMVTNRFAPILAHHAAAPLQHPKEFHELLVGVAGELATFTSQRRRPPDFPAYKHDDLQATFAPVIAELRRSLSAVLEQGAIQLPLQERRFGVRVAQIPDRSLLRAAQFVLAARADLPPDALRRNLPASVKIGPVEQIAQLVNVALPGIQLHPLAVAPPQLPYIANTTYFELDRTSEYFRALNNAGGIAIHVPGEWPKLELELWAIRAQA